MKKIIVALDGLKFSQGATDYAVHLANQSYSHLVGIFLDDFTYHSYKIYELINQEGLVSEQKKERLEEQDKAKRQVSTKVFEDTCKQAGVTYTIHHDRNIALQELLHESAYADLLVIDSKETLMHYEENRPTHFIRDLLVKTESPVLLTPGEYKPIDKLVLLYDGAPSSMYAIKIFSYLFPDLAQLPTEVLTVKNDNESNHLPHHRLMKEFMNRHFPNVTYTLLNGLADMEVINHLKNKNQNELIVLGAYERGTISRWFSPSMADALMQELKSPLFIAHKK
ncbi:MAG: universal stress protein [Bacteroidetes bacterium]|nr:universal stress protein [Bacteroidota bacterium]